MFALVVVGEASTITSSIPITYPDPAAFAGPFCPNTFTLFGNRCYSLVTDIRAPWVTANTLCEFLAPGGSLVTMEQQSDLYAITGYLMGKNEDCAASDLVWIGGITDNSSAEFVWSSSGNPISSSNWMNGEPESTETHSAIALDCKHQHKWTAHSIDESLHFMCQSSPLKVSHEENLARSVIVPVVADSECVTSRRKSSKLRRDFDCPPPFFKLGYSCYVFHRGLAKRTWEDSQEFCRRLAPHGKLAEFETFPEYYTMQQHLIRDGGCEKWKLKQNDSTWWVSKSPWIGAKENVTTHNFYWATSGEPMTLDIWNLESGGQPNNNQNGTAAGYLGCEKSYELFDHPRPEKKPFICEADPKEETQ
ncbi:unnamed protein product [Cyprideis torosa]|uniref:Uncharacterized protein n=1 Tax=Cyprideis torosa TaxID=163714 RepID=A0A7R8W9M7_9CRUS|nr:unnamed protein product [Cyprideis torosa]CAG0889984.1 unnamed protein product [Cyprideis torosa]